MTTASASLAQVCAFGVFDIVLLFRGLVRFLSLAAASPPQVVSCLVITPSVIPSRVLSLFKNMTLVPFIASFRTRIHIRRPTVCVTPCCVTVYVVAPSANPVRTEHCCRFLFQCMHVPRPISSSASSRVLPICTQKP